MTAAAARPSVVAIAPGDPFDPLTWSGSSHYLLTALERTGALGGAANGRPSSLVALEKAASFSPAPARWRQRYYASSSPLSPAIRAGMSWWAARRVAGIDRVPDVLLQLGAWYDFRDRSRLEPRLRASYHDGNLALSLQRADNVLDRDSTEVKRALRYERRVYDSMDLIMPMSDWLRRSFIDDFGQCTEKVVTVGAGANLRAIPARPDRDFSHPRVLFVGREFQRKGGPDLLAAFELVYAERPDAELWLVTAEQVATRPGVRSFGRILRNERAGELAIDRLYRQATAFVLPSRYEPFGIAFLEAMAYGLPCVGTDCCAIPEIIEDGVTGLLTPPADAAALAETLLSIIDDARRAEQMGEAGLRRLLEHYTWDAVAQRMLAAFDLRLAATG
jgi:glycosyltransferase involved in cell wall biosynthesis